MLADRTLLVDRLRRRLLTDVSGAGWGYYARKSGRIEPTCWALLALGSAWDPAHGEWAAFARPHLAFLVDRQARDGLLVETDPAYANFTANALAALVFASYAVLIPQAATARLHRGLVGVKGVRLKRSDSRQDDQLQGWPWVRDTFSWVEPTAWCLLAMKKADAAVRNAATDARAEEAEKLLVNRLCATGGWNYGNASALGQDLRAYVPTTAVGLFALQDKRTEPAVQQSLQWLVASRLSEPGAMALALTAMCLRLYGLPVDDVEDRMADAVQQSEESGNLNAMAMVAYALSADWHHMEGLRVGA